ncbi:MAG: hypothetical protein ACREP3_12630 [Candidatus Binatia bacterium]
METVTGIFDARGDAERAFSQLAESTEFDRENLLVLAPDSAPGRVDAIPTDEGEQPGMGSALGGVVGGAVGLATGAVLSNLVLPGIGPILTLSLSAGGGLGGALIGAAGGSAAERALSNGLPKDEVFFYEEALRRGRSLVIAMADSEDNATSARFIMERNKAESVDAAREKWWIGIRDDEAREYGRAQGDFAAQERSYRAGFEAALGPELRNRSFGEAESRLREKFPEIAGKEIFRRGYERGRQYLRSCQQKGESKLLRR